MNPHCRLCQADAVELLVDFGPQPIGNRYLRSSDEPESFFPLALCQCTACGLAQLKDAVPAEELKPRFDWITYNEAEGHLDETAQTIAGLPGVGPETCVWGVSYKDDTLLRRLERLGLKQSYRLAPRADLELADSAGVDQVQSRLTVARARTIAAKRGQAHVLIARHVVEHAEDLPGLLEALQSLVNPGGYLVLEVPDCTSSFALSDCAVMWEEHTVYFTPATFALVFDWLGLDLVFFRVFPYQLENALVGIGRRRAAGARRMQVNVERERVLLMTFAKGLPARQRQVVAALRARQGRAALLGAGHFGCTFLNLLGLRDEISLVVDGDSRKQGLYMPGSRVPIRGPEELQRQKRTFCLLAVQPAAEAGVLEMNRAWVASGGEFASIFAASPRYLLGRKGVGCEQG
jgi:hypothetical protein